MEYRTLAATDLNVSRIGFGCWALGGYGWGRVDDRQSVAAVRAALDLGVNLFDTADVYGIGYSEEILAEALGECRRDVVIATKFGVTWDAQHGSSRVDVGPQRVVEALEGSLRRLQLDAIPLYQIHRPDGTTPIEETLGALTRCQEAGKVRWIGCCNFPADLLRAARAAARVVSIQAPYNIVDRGVETTLLGTCRELDVDVLAYGSLAQGLFSGKYEAEPRFDREDVRSRSAYFHGTAYGRNRFVVDRLKEVAAACGRTPAQVAIRWVLDNPAVACALVGIKTVAQLMEDTEIDWVLSPANRALISALGATAACGDVVEAP